MRVTGVSSLTLISWFKFLGSQDKLKSLTHLVCLVVTCWVFWLQHEPCKVTERKELQCLFVCQVYYIFCFVYLDLLSWTSSESCLSKVKDFCKDHFDAVFLYQRVRSRSGSAIQDHSDHDRSNEPMNPLWTRIQRQNGCSILSRDVVSLDLESSISTAYRQSSFICPISSASAIMKKTLPF